MPKFSANLTTLFRELDFLDRFHAAALAGFKAIEIQFPYDHPKQQLAQVLTDSGLSLVLHNLPAGNWAGGDRGIACHPDRVNEFRAGVQLAIEYASALGCHQLNCLAGIVPAGVSKKHALAVLMANLSFAATALQEVGIRLLIEPINRYDIPGFLVIDTRQALELINACATDNLFLQYDVYHAQRSEGELAATIAACLPHIAHIQVADNPGRHEPGTGEINYAWLFREIDRLGYGGWIGCEYNPLAGTAAGLGWLHAAATHEFAMPQRLGS